MYNAPSVTYPVGRCRFYAAILLVLSMLSLAVLCIWWGSVERHSLGPAGVGLAAWLAWLGFAVWSWWHSPVGRLQWDATAPTPVLDQQGAWFWRSASFQDGTPLPRVKMVFDLQQRVLLCLYDADALTRWIWVERARDPSRWRDLRCALVAHT